MIYSTTVRPIRRIAALALAVALGAAGAIAGIALPAQAAGPYTVTGTVTGKASAAAAPVPLAGMYLYVQREVFDYSAGAVNYWGASADASGNFTISVPQAGRYTMQFNCSSVGSSSCKLDYPVQFLGNSTDVQHAEGFALNDTTPSVTRNETIDKGSTISGRITDETGQAAADTYVYGNRPDMSGGGFGKTDSAGNFTLTMVPSGNIILSTQYYSSTENAETRRYYYTSYYGNTNSPSTATRIPVSPGSTQTAKNISLQKSPSLRVRFVDEAGEPISGAQFSTFALNATTGRYESPRSGESLGSNANGYYSTGLRAGNYKFFMVDNRDPSVDDYPNEQTRTNRYDSEWYNDVPTLSQAEPLVVSAASDDRTDLTVVLHENDGTVGYLGGLSIARDFVYDDGTLSTEEYTNFTPQGAAHSRQWYADGVAIAGATDSIYKPTAAQAGAEITVKVTVTLGTSSVSKTSGAYTVPGGKAFTGKPTPTVSGSAAVGSTLTGEAGTWTPAADSYLYKWNRGTTVVGTAKTYAPSAGDVGAKLTLTVTARKAGYLASSTTSAATAAVSAGPIAAGSPTVSGTATVGETVTASPGSWGANVAFAYQWLGDGSTIAGATASTYKISGSAVGKKLSVRVTGTRAGAAPAIATSSETAAVSPGSATGATPTITGVIRVGNKVTAAAGTWTPSSVTKTYQWSLDGTAVTGATASTFTLPSGSIAKTLSVTVTGTQLGYTTLSKSSTSTTVAAGVFTKVTPTISGKAKVGSTLTLKRGTWSPSSGTTYTYRWYVKSSSKGTAKAISGATKSTYKISSSRAAKYIAVKVTAKRTGYTSASATSKYTAKIAK